MDDYIRKAIELADGWNPVPHNCAYVDPDQHDLDALAAQLVRQMDELVLYRVRIEPTGTFIYHEGTGELITDSTLGGNRTMNTIKAIVDSGVL